MTTNSKVKPKARSEATSAKVAADAARMTSVPREYDGNIVYLGVEAFTVKQLKAVGASALTQAPNKRLASSAWCVASKLAS